MLIQSDHKGIYERIVASKNGQLVRVRFAVVEVDGTLRGRIISATPIISVEYKISSCTSQLCLPGAKSAAQAIEYKISSCTKPSPYFSSLEFFMSQPTRAPSFS